VDYKLVLDVIIALLLAATIVYALVLNRRLGILRRNGEELAKLIARFNEATLRAESSIPKLRKAAEEAGQALQERVEKAQSLRDDLAFMIERADTMATKLETGVRNARTEARPTSRPMRPVIAATSGSALQEDDALDERSEAERELLRALQSAR
jgi:hypothetical protein